MIFLYATLSRNQHDLQVLVTLPEKLRYLVRQLVTAPGHLAFNSESIED